MTESRAQRFFRQESGDFESLHALIGEEENQWRDFKAAETFYVRPPGKEVREEEEALQMEIKKHWSENLSAFANSGGGVLIWGIRAPNRVAKKLSLAKDAPRLAARLKQLQNDAVDPPVSGVEIREVTRTASREGFVVCYIPDSKASPHRANWATREYYMRVGDSNRPIPTALLRRMFHPRFFPWVTPVATARLSKGHDQLLHLEIAVKIQNRGVASAEDLCIKVEARLGDSPPRMCESRFWDKRDSFLGGFNCRITIHPHDEIPFLDNVTRSVGFKEPPTDDLCVRLAFRIYALHAAALFSEVAFTGSELSETLATENAISREGVTVLMNDLR